MGLSHHHYFPHPFSPLFKSACQNLLFYRYPITLPSWQSSPNQQSKIEKMFSRIASMYNASLRQQPMVVAMTNSFNNENRLLVLPTQMQFNFLLSLLESSVALLLHSVPSYKNELANKAVLFILSLIYNFSYTQRGEMVSKNIGW